MTLNPVLALCRRSPLPSKAVYVPFHTDAQRLSCCPDTLLTASHAWHEVNIPEVMQLPCFLKEQTIPEGVGQVWSYSRRRTTVRSNSYEGFCDLANS